MPSCCIRVSTSAEISENAENSEKWPFLENMLKILKNHILLKVCGDFAEKGSEIFV